MTKLSWTAVGLCCLAAILQPPVGPQWLFLGLIGVALALMAVSLVVITRRFNREWADAEEALELLARWRAERERCR